MTPSELKSKIDKLKGARTQIQKQIGEARRTYITASRDATATEEAQAIIQDIARKTQDQIRYHVTDLGSMALNVVFSDDIRLGLDFNPSRGKTEAKLAFLRGKQGISVDPLEADSGGACDIAAEALRDSLWYIQRPRTRPIMLRDEPFKNINDPTRQMHERASEMIQQISKRLGLQFIIVTAVPELAEIADKTFRF